MAASYDAVEIVDQEDARLERENGYLKVEQDMRYFEIRQRSDCPNATGRSNELRDNRIESPYARN